MLAGTGVSGEQVLLRQSAATLRANGAPDAAIESSRKVLEALFTIVRSDVSEEEKVRQARAQLGSIPGIDQQVKTFSDPWARYFLALDPAPILEKVSCPVLVLNGDLDTQVVAEQNLPAIEGALRKGGNKGVTTKRFAKLNHLFQTASTGAPSEYNSIEETISPAVLETISNWIAKPAKWVGRWNLNVEKSTFGTPLAPGTPAGLKITAQSLRFEQTAGEVSLSGDTVYSDSNGSHSSHDSNKLSLDGQPTVLGPISLSFRGIDDFTFEIVSQLAIPGHTIEEVSRFSISSDGKTLTETKTQTEKGLPKAAESADAAVKTSTSVLVFSRLADQ